MLTIQCFLLFLFVKRYVYKFFILSWIIAPLFLVSIIHSQTPRYTFPIVPAVALLISITIFRLKISGFKRLNRLLKLSVILLIIAIGLMQFFYLCYYDVKPKILPDLIDMSSKREEYTGLLHPEKVTWAKEIDKLMVTLNENSKRKNSKGKYLMLTNEENLPLFQQLVLEATIGKLPIEFTYPLGCLSGNNKCYPERYHKLISNATFMLVHEYGCRSIGCTWLVSSDKKALETYYWPFMEIFESQKSEFEILKKIDLENNSTVVLYYRIKEHENG